MYIKVDTHNPHYKNYFIYAYNKDFYKGNKVSKKSSKHRKSKVYKA